MSKIKGILFDYDGVMADSEALHFQAFKKVLADEKISLTRTHYDETLIGFDDRDAFVYMNTTHHKNWSAEYLETLNLKKRQLFAEMLHEPKCLFDGVIENLPQLVKKFKLGIVSGARKSEINRINEFNGIQKYFEFVVAADDVQHSKPSPEGYLMGYEKMEQLIPGLKKSEVLVVEDTHHGITAAKEAGLFVIGISTSHGLSVLKSFKPSMTVNDHKELFEYLRSL